VVTRLPLPYRAFLVLQNLELRASCGDALLRLLPRNLSAHIPCFQRIPDAVLASRDTAGSRNTPVLPLGVANGLLLVYDFRLAGIRAC